MRDRQKDQKYYNAYLEYQYSRIEKKTAKLRECEEEKKQRILVSLTGFEVDLLKAEFSSGASGDDMKTLLIRAIDIVSEYNNITYEDLLVLLSLSIMLGTKEDAKKLLVKNDKIIKSDRLLTYVSSYVETGKAVWDRDIPISEEYAPIESVIEGSDKVNAMSKYLDGWYANHSGYAWYDSHLSDMDIYCGYWSFESAAVVKILDMDDETLRGTEYYPAL